MSLILLKTWRYISRLLTYLLTYYLMKLERLIVHILPLRSYRKKHQNLYHLNCGLQI